MKFLSRLLCSRFSSFFRRSFFRRSFFRPVYVIITDSASFSDCNSITVIKSNQSDPDIVIFFYYYIGGNYSKIWRNMS